MEIKEIIVPENWEIIIEDGVVTFKEKKWTPPRSWEEFCKCNPIKAGETFIDCTENSDPITEASYSIGKGRKDKYWCISKEEAEAFLAFMQLRQLRKAWVEDWKQPNSKQAIGAILYNRDKEEVVVDFSNFWSGISLSFPTVEMAREFFDCFKDLCETAKILL